MKIKRFVALFVVTSVLLLSSCSFRTTDLDSLFSDQDSTKTVTNAPAENSAPVTDVPETDPPVTKTASFLGVGDNIIYYGNVRDAAALAVPGGRKYNFVPAYDNVASMISAADVAFVNQETLMCGDGWDYSYYPTFNGPRDAGHALVDVGFDVVNIASNHMLDKGGAGLNATIDFWKRMNVTMIGGYSDETDYKTVRVHEVNGIRIAFLAYTYGTNGINLASGFNTKIPYLYRVSGGGDITDYSADKIVYEADLAADVAAAREAADFVFISVHWGEENHFEPNGVQKHYAKVMADAGADAIIGHHPHVIQPVEWIEGKNGNRTLCIYSLGNFMAEMAADYNMVGGMITFNMNLTGNDRAITDVVFIPTVFHFPANFYNNKIYLMEDYTEELAARHGVKSYYNNPCSLARMRKYVTDTISFDFLPEFIK